MASDNSNQSLISLVITSVVSLVTGLGLAHFQYKSKKEEIGTETLKVILDGWKTELTRLKLHCEVLEKEVDALKMEGWSSRNKITELENENKYLKVKIETLSK